MLALVIESRECKCCKQPLPIDDFPLRQSSGTRAPYREGTCKACRKMLDAERYKAKFGNGQVPRRKRAKYARSDAPDPLNVVARRWMGPAWGPPWAWEWARD